MVRRILLVTLATLAGSAAAGGRDDGAPLANPYFPRCTWKVWRRDDAPVTDARAFVPPATAPPSTLAPPLQELRLWPAAKLAKGRAIALEAKPSRECAGTWDDVYASWSGTHGWMRDRWAAPGGDEAAGLAKAVIAVVDAAPGATHAKLGVNFYHQSTTGMGHTITNAVVPSNTLEYEKLYFASGLICAPCHLSWVEEGPANAACTTDLYLALMPTLFHSLGSSDSETMAITKWVIAGAHLAPEMKLELKQSGLYASTMLWLWKSCLPVESDYDEEWRHRLVYAAVGDRFAFPGGYDATGLARGDQCLAFHEYDDGEHERRMVAAARALTVAPPEAVVDLLEQQGGTTRVSLKKTIAVLQPAGSEVKLRVSAAASYDLATRPLTFRWRLLHGNRRTQVEREGDAAQPDASRPPTWTITVPWDEALPEGRTTLLLVANNGVHDGNPAAVTIYRQRGDLPPSGQGYNDFNYDTKFANRRPTIVGLQDLVVKPGEVVTLPIRALDPEGQPLRFTKRAGDPGELDGNLFTWKVPSREPAGARSLTLLCSDGTAGNSYEAQTIALQVKPKVAATIKADVVAGAAPLTVKFTGSGKGEWAFAPRGPGRGAMPAVESSGASATKTFDQPGVYEAWFKLKSGSDEDVTRMAVLVTAQPLPSGRPSTLIVEGNGAFIADGDATPCPFDATDFGVPLSGQPAVEHAFLLHVMGDAPLPLGRANVKLEGEGAASFTIARPPRGMVDGGGSTRLVLRFQPKAPGVQRATVEIATSGSAAPMRFAVQGGAAGKE